MSSALRAGARSLGFLMGYILIIIVEKMRKYMNRSKFQLQIHVGVECIRCGLLRPMIPTSVSLSVTRYGCANMAVRIEVLLGVKTHGNPWHIVFYGLPICDIRK